MSFLDIARQLLLFIHLMVFAIAIAEILREDWRLFRSEQIDTEMLNTTSRNIKFLLVGLWASGIALVWFRTGSELQSLLADPKFHAKILVVSVLTINGLLLHLIAFPLLRGEIEIRSGSAMLLSVLGAISTTSWLVAGFIGTSRIIAPHLSFSMFIGLYEIALISGLLTAMVFVRPRLRHKLVTAPRRRIPDKNCPIEGADNTGLTLLQQIEAAASAMGQAQNQLQAIRASAFSGGGLLPLPDPDRDRPRQANNPASADQAARETVLRRAATR